MSSNVHEIEVKILEVDKEDIIKKLKNLGAKQDYVGWMNIEFFDYKDQKLFNEKKMLRVREKEDKIELTFKELVKSDDVKSAQEYEVELKREDKENIKKILNRIGLEKNREMKKHRESYTLNNLKIQNVRFEFDTFEGTPTFLEIEAHDETTLRKAVEILGFRMEDTKAWSGKEVIEHYASNK